MKRRYFTAVITAFIMIVVALLALLLFFSNAGAQEDGQPMYLPWLGKETGHGPFRVTGKLEKIYPIEAYSCQIIHLIELYDYNPMTGTGVIVYDSAWNPGDITGDPEKGETPGFFVLNEVLDEYGVPADIPTSDWLFMVGMPECAEGSCYDIVEWPVVKLYPGSIVDVGTIYAKEVRQYCWSDPDNERRMYEFETVNGEMVITQEVQP